MNAGTLSNNTERATVLALVGLPAAGKSTIARCLQEDYGFKWIRTRDLIHDAAATDSTASLQTHGLTLTSGEGAERFVKKILAQCVGFPHIVVDSLRPLSHLRLLEAELGISLRLVAISAPMATRQQRLNEREGVDTRLIERDEHPVEAEIGALMDCSDYHLRNIDLLPQRIESMLSMIAWSQPLPSAFSFLATCATPRQRRSMLRRAVRVLAPSRREVFQLPMVVD